MVWVMLVCFALLHHLNQIFSLPGYICPGLWRAVVTQSYPFSQGLISIQFRLNALLIWIQQLNPCYCWHGHQEAKLSQLTHRCWQNSETFFPPGLMRTIDDGWMVGLGDLWVFSNLGDSMILWLINIFLIKPSPMWWAPAVLLIILPFSL